jgi:hypothetical protein
MAVSVESGDFRNRDLRAVYTDMDGTPVQTHLRGLARPAF